MLTIDATDPKSGTAEFKATAVRVEKLNGDDREAAGGRRAARPATSVDVRLLDAEPTAAERDAVDAFLGPAGVELGRCRSGRRTVTPLTAAMPRARSATSCCRRCTRSTSSAGWISPGALNYIARRLTIPPADVYGVATFYALFSVEPRAPRVLHVCDDVVCRCAGSQALIATLDRAVGPQGSEVDGDQLAAQPVPGAVRPGAGRPARRVRSGAARARADRRSRPRACSR